MKTTLMILCTLGVATAFAPVAFVRGPSTSLFSDKKADDETEGLDLNLEEMFDMFEAADKGKKFDDTVEKVKGKSK
jgi:hypothetical protein